MNTTRLAPLGNQQANKDGNLKKGKCRRKTTKKQQREGGKKKEEKKKEKKRKEAAGPWLLLEHFLLEVANTRVKGIKALVHALGDVLPHCLEVGQERVQDRLESVATQPASAAVAAAAS